MKNRLPLHPIVIHPIYLQTAPNTRSVFSSFETQFDVTEPAGSPVETAAEQPQPAQLPRLLTGSATSASSHAATVAAAAGQLQSAAQPTAATALCGMSGNTFLSEVLQTSIAIKPHSGGSVTKLVCGTSLRNVVPDI